tara:strand:- start:764 stop:1117 length:354 start_codon:yes stop_codon:yes gene_type:complete
MNQKLKSVIENHKVIVASYDCYTEDDWHYEDFQYNMKEELKSMGNSWDIECRNANWRGSTGYMTSSDPDKVISAILMNNGECNTEIWEGENDTLEGVCYHHDCPTGSWFTIKKSQDD